MPTFDPRDPGLVRIWTVDDVASLPAEESDTMEYKSSQTSDSELSNKISKAASAFWYAGGGVFVAGVNDTGHPDGGVESLVGRQSRQDWIDQAVGRTIPRGPYAHTMISTSDPNLDIGAGKGIVAIAFGESTLGPHMAYDGKYYVRSGAHTVVATHFIVEAIRARRGLLSPSLRPLLRSKRDQRSIVELTVVALNDAPALDVTVDVTPMPPIFGDMHDPFPVRPQVIDRDNPLTIDVGTYGGPQAMHAQTVVRLQYRDVLGRVYDERFELDPAVAMPSIQVGKSAIEELTDAIKALRGTLRLTLSRTAASGSRKQDRNG